MKNVLIMLTTMMAAFFFVVVLLLPFDPYNLIKIAFHWIISNLWNIVYFQLWCHLIQWFICGSWDPRPSYYHTWVRFASLTLCMHIISFDRKLIACLMSRILKNKINKNYHNLLSCQHIDPFLCVDAACP